MSKYRIVYIESLAQLPAAAAKWDDLWQRSDATLPTGRAELVAQWIEQFASSAKFIALAVEQDGQYVAAIPLVQRCVKRALKVGSLPWNDWCWAGELLVDQEVQPQLVLEALLGEIRLLPWSILWFDTIPYEARRWSIFLKTLDDQGLPYALQPRVRFGTVEIADQLACDWELYERAWSGNHRRHMRKALRRAAEHGGVELDIRRPPAEEVESLLREGFEIEHRSWKGSHGTSVMQSPEMWEFYVRQATQIARYGDLELVFLRHRGKAIAFEYGWQSKGIYFTPKVGYDAAYSNLSPGQLLRYLLLEQSFAHSDHRAIDFLGPLSDATAKWSTNAYGIGRLAVSTGGAAGRALIWGMNNVWNRYTNRRGDKGSNDHEILQLELQSELPASAVTS